MSAFWQNWQSFELVSRRPHHDTGQTFGQFSLEIALWRWCSVLAVRHGLGSHCRCVRHHRPAAKIAVSWLTRNTGQSSLLSVCCITVRASRDTGNGLRPSDNASMLKPPLARRRNPHKRPLRTGADRPAPQRSCCGAADRLIRRGRGPSPPAAPRRPRPASRSSVRQMKETPAPRRGFRSRAEPELSSDRRGPGRPAP